MTTNGKQDRATNKQPSTTLEWYLKEISGTPLLSYEEEAQLTKKLQAGDQQALETLVKANLRFVASEARKFENPYVPLEDLINEGNLGLIEAAKRFDPTRGNKFISYAVWWVHRKIHVALAEHLHAVRLPMNLMQEIRDMEKVIKELSHVKGRKPSDEEIAAAADIKVCAVQRINQASQKSSSLDYTPSSATDLTLLHAIPDSQIIPVPKLLEEQELHSFIEAQLQELTAQEADVLALYFGLRGNEPMTLEEIGEWYNVGRERIRQIKEKALRRLRHPPRMRQLDEYRTPDRTF